jgi:molybdopterin/thiamine biosynthesis adenylyltransferase
MARRPALRVDLDAEHDRYHRQSLIAWWDQDRLREARVVVVGAGALGNELVKNLALLGVGTILVVDLDRVENSNLSRCVFFRSEDEGREKALVVAERAAELNPEIRVVGIPGDVRLALGLGVFRDADVVLGGLDNREARVFVNQACWKTTTPWVDGAIEGLMGIARAFVPPDSADYESTMNARDHQLLAARRACTLLSREEMQAGKVPTTATSSSVVAAIQAQEAVKLLHRDRLAYDFAGKGFVFNGLTHDSYVVSYTTIEESLGRDTYELDDAREFDADVPLRTLLTQAEEDLGDGAVVEFEHEVVVGMTCADCDASTRVHRPALALSAADAGCPDCGAERTIDIVHAVDRARADVLDLSVGDLHLPPHDVVTARAGIERRHYVVGAERSPLRVQLAGGRA